MPDLTKPPCPRPLTPVDLEYGDKKEQYNATISHSVKESVAPEDWIPPRLPPFPDLQSQEAQDALRSVLSALRMEPESIDVSAADVACAKSVLESQILPTLAEAARLPGSAPTSASALSRFPLGFSTGDESVDVAATVLRLLYIKDLRSLQTQIDEAIVEQQEMTAHPRTDAAAGRVGR